jgi:hypothetical protein
MITKKLGIDWNKLSHNDKIFLKGEMIDQYAGTGSINEERWQNDLYRLQIKNRFNVFYTLLYLVLIFVKQFK